MRIAFVDYTQSLGGANRANIQMAQNVNKEHEAFLVDFYGNNQNYVDECKQSGVPIDILIPEGQILLGAEKNIIRRVVNVVKMCVHIFHMNSLINKYVNDNDIDYIAVSSIRPLLCLAVHKPIAKVVFFAHGWYLNSQMSWLFRFLLKKVVDKIACISEPTRHSMFNCGIAPMENLFVVHNYIDESIINHIAAFRKEKDDVFIINHCGGFIPGKGQHISIEIAKRLKERGIMFKLILTGIIYKYKSSKDYYEKILELINKYELSDYVEIILNHTNVLEYTKGCDVLIHPSASEGFPLAILEAMIMKKPVIANPVGGVTDMVIDNYNGYLVHYNDIEEYVEKIMMIAEDKELYNYLSNNSYCIATHSFNQDIQLEKLKSVFT